MRNWNTDGSIEADTRYPRWFKWVSQWAPDWVMTMAMTLVNRRS